MTLGHALVAGVAVLFFSSAVAEERTPRSPMTGTMQADGRLPGAVSSARGQAWERSRRATNVIGARVFGGPGHERVGQIEDLVIDRDGGISIAVLNLNPNVLSAAPAPPPADRLHAVPWSALRFDDTMQHFMLEVDVERLAGGPSFARGSWPDMTDADWRRRMDRHYGRSYAVGREVPQRR